MHVLQKCFFVPSKTILPISGETFIVLNGNIEISIEHIEQRGNSTPSWVRQGEPAKDTQIGIWDLLASEKNNALSIGCSCLPS